MSEFMTGKIKWFSGKLMYGFINGDDGVSYFFHKTNIAKEYKNEYLRHNTKVKFKQMANEKGDFADDIRIVSE